jgi:hypothetical protein
LVWPNAGAVRNTEHIVKNRKRMEIRAPVVGIMNLDYLVPK